MHDVGFGVGVLVFVGVTAATSMRFSPIFDSLFDALTPHIFGDTVNSYPHR